MGDVTRELTARQLAALVRAGDLLPVESVQSALERIAAADAAIGAFEFVCADEAVAEAERLAARSDLDALPLAGVPVAIKDNVDVEGLPTRKGSPATSGAPASADDELVRRLRNAGAIVVGKTRCPELCLWGSGDNAWGTARNPWDPARTPGGSSSGSGAAVAAGMVPVALASDGLGSIRIPGAACGLVGIKPGTGLLPPVPEKASWFGLTQFGPLATTVSDAALVLDVLAGRISFRHVAAPQGPLRVAISTRPPIPVPVDEEIRSAIRGVGDLLAGAGHAVTPQDPPYPPSIVPQLYSRWFAGAARDAEGMDLDRLEPRTRRHVHLGRAISARWPIKQGGSRRWSRRYASWFASTDVLVLPVLATDPISAGPWASRSWARNVAVNTRYAPFCAVWNLVGFPAMTVPAGISSAGMPIGAQLVAPRGGEQRLLSVAMQLEQLQPWRRHA